MLCIHLSVICACGLQPTDAKALQKWYETNQEGKPKHQGRKKWDKYIGEHLCATDLPDYAPSYPTTCFGHKYGPGANLSVTRWVGWTNAETAVVRQPVAAPAAQPVAQPIVQPIAQPIAQPVMASVNVTCPAGSKGGDMIQIQHNSAVFNVAVPAGVAGGQVFMVQLPETAAVASV